MYPAEYGRDQVELVRAHTMAGSTAPLGCDGLAAIAAAPDRWR
jgi:hypothetical protein